MFYVSSTETVYRSFTTREEAERYAHLMELRGYPKGFLQVEERGTNPAETIAKTTGSTYTQLCNHQISDGNTDDPSYAYCGYPAAHAGSHGAWKF